MVRFNMVTGKKIGISMIIFSIAAILLLLSVHMEKELFYSYGEDIVGEWRWFFLKNYKLAALPFLYGIIYAVVLRKTCRPRVIGFLNVLAITYAIFVTVIVVRFYLAPDIEQRYKERTRTLILPGKEAPRPQKIHGADSIDPR